MNDEIEVAANTSSDELVKIEHEDDDVDQWIDFEIILTRMIGKIGVIRYLEDIEDEEDEECVEAICEFFTNVKMLYDMTGQLYSSYIVGDSVCVYCERVPRSDWDDEERHDDIVFFQQDGKTAIAHRFCRSEAVRNENVKR